MADKPKHFVVNLKPAHDKLGLSPYMVAKQTGVAINTVVKYTATENLVIERVEIALIILMNFYGLNWRDPNDVKVIYEDEPQEQQKALLAAS